MEGYVKIFRSILEWEWVGSANMLGFWVYLLMKAETSPRKWKGMVIERGQIVTTIKELADESGLSVQQIRTILGRLSVTNEITNKTTNKFTIITICKYDRYNGVENDDQQTKQQTSNKRATNKITNKKNSETPVNTAIEALPKTQSNKQNNKQDLERPKSEPALADNLQSCSNNINHSDNIDPTIENKKNNKENLQKKEQKQKEINAPLLGEEFALTGDDRKPSYDFVAPMFEKAFTTWLDYKRERKETYKSRKSLKVCYTHMVKMSGGSPEMAMAIVEQSMANNWAGLFELKTTTNHGDNKKTREQERDERMQGYTDLVARLVAKGRASRAAGGAADERQ